MHILWMYDRSKESYVWEIQEVYRKRTYSLMLLKIGISFNATTLTNILERTIIAEKTFIIVITAINNATSHVSFV